MQPDLDEYWPYLDGFDLDDEEKRQLIHTLWIMMESFVDSAFGTHPVQQAIKDSNRKDSNVVPDAVELKSASGNQESLPRQFKRKAARKRKS